MVIATKLDRMFRDTRDALETIRWFKSRGIVLYLLDLGGQVTDDQVCYMLFTIVAAVAEFERERIAERTREAMAALRRNGKYTGGTAPFGWRWKDGELHEVAAEQVTIRRICELDDRGQGYAKIAGHLGLPPRKVKTILWRAKDPAGLAQYNARKKAAARRCKLTGQAPRPGTTPASTTKTFAAAIAAYAQSRGLPLDAHPARAVDRLNIRRLRRLIEALGNQPLAVISEEDLRALANRLYPSNPPATKNREVIGPAHAILHHAAAQGWIAKRTGTLLT